MNHSYIQSLTAYLDDIANLKDPELFYDIIMAELEARSPPDPQKKPSTAQDASFMASLVAMKIHNAYILASGWKVVLDTIMDFIENGLTDDSVKAKLKNDYQFRLRYLVLCDTVNELVNMGQAKFSALAMTTPHYAPFFKRVDGSAPDELDMQFDWGQLRAACLSFLDSIIIELCFPRPPYPKDVLLSVLHDAVTEAPKEAKRFPQALWDAVGDLSTSVELQSLLGAPLLGPNNASWNNAPREMPDEYEDWVDAQIYSGKASNKYANFKNIIFPLEKTRNKSVLDEMWRLVNVNYVSISGQEIDALWKLSTALDYVPQWHAFYMPFIDESAEYNSDESVGKKVMKNATRGRLALVDDVSDDSHNSMPSLHTASASSEEDFKEASDDIDDDTTSTDESGYDTGEEEALRDKLRVAMDVAHEAGLYDVPNPSLDSDPSADDDERAENPFLTLLKSLRGRAFSSSPKLRTSERSEPRKQGTASVATDVYQKALLEETKEVKVGDEHSEAPRKKKKKYKKKKISLTTVPGQAQANLTSVPQESKPELPEDSSSASRSTNVKQSPSLAKASVASAKAASTSVPAAQRSTASLLLPTVPTVAQSARSYIRSEQLDVPRNKIKSRGDHASIFSKDCEDEKKSMFSRLRLKRSKDKSEEEQKEQKKAKQSWYSKLGKRATRCMHQLLRTSRDEKQGTAPMKWDHFVSVWSDHCISEPV
ncbi:hypothetical protein AX17_004022 [Amanita inopinata Kibby_2008]|nr:hypothetical protein AX17_004022 [Amanita inopinata Kibby_2008]